MSSADDDTIVAAQARMMCCASCGITEVDDVELKPCDGCDLVKYCSDACQELHRPEHAGKCRKRAAELRDEILFRQPECTHLGDCPICSLPLQDGQDKSAFYSCCCKSICRGCSFAHETRQWDSSRQWPVCPFCRHIQPKTEEEFEKNFMKRVEANDPHAMNQMGLRLSRKGDNESAVEYYTKAAELGDVGGHYNLSVMYSEGRGVEKDEKKELYHLEESAIGGHPYARNNLGTYELKKGMIDRAVKHWIIAANLGNDLSIKILRQSYKNGHISKEDFAAALRAYQAALNETKSPQREAAARYYSANGLQLW